jgi:RND family efflux transporter MFP subunit
MRQKTILIGGIIVLCLATGIFVAVKWHGGATPAADESEDENVPTIIPVQTGTLQRVTLHGYVSGYGTVEAEPATEKEPAAGGTLAAPGAGVVARVDVVAGQQVKKGKVLVELNSAVETYDYAEAEAERQKKLFAQQNTSQKDLEDAEAQLASLAVVAPVSGTVTRIAVVPGQAVDVNALVAEVMDLNRLAVAARIPASQAGGLKTGEKVEVGEGAQPTPATLSFVSPAVDATDGTVPVWAALPADSGLKPGQFVPLRIVTEVESNCLAAPAESVVTDENGNSVIALVQSNEATLVPVQTGLRENDWVQIEATNLNVNDTVVTVGAYGLPDKTQIKVVNPVQ